MLPLVRDLTAAVLAPLMLWLPLAQELVPRSRIIDARLLAGLPVHSPGGGFLDIGPGARSYQLASSGFAKAASRGGPAFVKRIPRRLPVSAWPATQNDPHSPNQGSSQDLNGALNGAWQDSFGAVVQITQTGSAVKLRARDGREFSGSLDGMKLQLSHQITSIKDLPAAYNSYPPAAREMLIGQSVTITCTINPDFEGLTGEIVTPGVEYDPKTFAIISRKEHRQQVSFTRVPPPAILQYQPETVVISGDSIPSPSAGNISFSDAALRVVEILKASSTSVTLKVFADKGAKPEPVDVTIGDFVSKKAFRVQRIEGVLWLVERLRPDTTDSTLSTYDFDLSIRLFTSDPKDPDHLVPLKGESVAFGASGAEGAAVTSVAGKIDDLKNSEAPWLKTDETGRVYCTVHADASRGSPIVEARFGYLDENVSARGHAPRPVLASYHLQNPPARDNAGAFSTAPGGDSKAQPPAGDLTARTFDQKQGYVQESNAANSAEKIAKDDGQVKALLFKALIETGVVADPRYQIILLAVGYAQEQINSAPTATPPRPPSASDLGINLSGIKGAGEIVSAITAANDLDATARKLAQSALSGKKEDIARAVYGGLMLGGLTGAKNALFDQTLGNIYYLGEWVADYVKWAREHPGEAITNQLKIALWLNPVTAPMMAGIKIAKTVGPALVKGIKWIFGLDSSEPQKDKAKVEETSFQVFLDKCFDFFQNADAGQLKFALMNGATTAMVLANQLLLAATAMIPRFSQEIVSFAEAIDIKNGTTAFSLFACGYWVGMVAGYAVVFIGLEVLIAIVSDGLATYVKGVAWLGKAWSIIQKAGKVVHYGNILMMLSQLNSLVEAFTKDPAQDDAALGPFGYGNGILLAYASPGPREFLFAGRPANFLPVLPVAPLPAAPLGRKAAQILIGILKTAAKLAGDSERLARVLEPLFTGVTALSQAKAARILMELVEEGHSKKFEELMEVLSKLDADVLKTWPRSITGVLFTAGHEEAGAKVLSVLAKREAGKALDSASKIGKSAKAPRFWAAMFDSAEEAAHAAGKPATDSQRVINFLEAMGEHDRQVAKLGEDEINRVGLRQIFEGEMPQQGHIRTSEMNDLPDGLSYKDFRKAMSGRPDALSYVEDIVQHLDLTGVSEEYSRAFYDIQLKEIRKNMKVVITRVKGERVIARETYVKNFSQLIKDWETNTGLKWPVDKGGTRLQAHHFIPLESGGHNAWYNLVPLTGKFHQGNIHIPGSTLKDLFQGIGENFVVQLFE